MRNVNFAAVSKILIIILLFSNSDLFSGLNLPQSSAKILIKGKNHQQLKKYFEPIEDGIPSIDTTVEKLLIKLFPKSFDEGCKEMIATWGKEAKGTASNVLRVVFMKNHSKNLQQVFLALTCYSSASAYGDKFYDERLALLTIDSTSSSLVTLPHGKPCDTCSDLSRIGMNEEWEIGRKHAVSILFSTSTRNPCCEGDYLKEEVIEKYFLFDPPNVKDILTIVKRRSERFHRDNAIDSVVVYETNSNINKDANGSILKIDVDYSLTVNNAPVNQGVMWYTWDKKLKKFESNRH